MPLLKCRKNPPMQRIEGRPSWPPPQASPSHEMAVGVWALQHFDREVLCAQSVTDRRMTDVRVGELFPSFHISIPQDLHGVPDRNVRAQPREMQPQLRKTPDIPRCEHIGAGGDDRPCLLFTE